MIRHLVEKIEGEAYLTFKKKRQKIQDVEISFPHFRGIESILTGRPALDALVISPRVCGICGHSHLMAAVRALEAVLKNGGIEVSLSHTARTIRDLTLYGELIQNHLKWFYLVLYPRLAALSRTIPPSYLKMHRAVRQTASFIALFTGQWPHSSYAFPGGVICDPAPLELAQAKALLSSVAHFFTREVIRAPLEEILSMERCAQLMRLCGDLPDLLRLLEKEGIATTGQSFGRFITLGEHSLFNPAKMVTNSYHILNLEKIREEEPRQFGEKTFAKIVRYNGNHYETGPLARAMTQKNPLIRAMYHDYKDSLATRITARVVETALLLAECLRLLDTLETGLPPETKADMDWKKISGTGTGVVEAPRGSLVHTLTLEEGTIRRSEIITPTQWNLGNGTPEDPGIAQKAMIGLDSTEVAELVFRSFDICSVCTTH
ncbi:nickel-dependent hydrogenase large subunit [Hydrogenimonas sp.]